jgi:tetratricopeptide (TPR) repeat protein
MATPLEKLRQEAEEFFQKENFSAIISLLSDNILAEYNDPILYSWKARALYRTSNNDEAFLLANKAINLDPKCSLAYVARGNVLSNKGEIDKAIEDYNKAIELKPDDANFYYNRGVVLHNIGEMDKAIADYNKAIELKADDADYYYNRGIVLHNKGEMAKAIEDYTKAIELNPDLGIVWYNLGLSLKQKADFKAALKVFEKAKEIGNRVGDAQWQISDIRDLLSASINDEIAKDIKKIKAIVGAIRQKSLTGKEITRVVHYSKLFVADILSNDPDSHLHYSNVIYMNDPEEGKTFLNFLNDPDIKEWFEKSSYKNESTIFLGSFLPVTTQETDDGDPEDQLLLWRTYGKDESGMDAGGCNFVIDTSFFDDGKTSTALPLPETFEKIKAAIENGLTFSEDNRNRLLKVQYIRKNKIIKDNDNIITELVEYLKEEIKKLIEKNKKEEGNIDARLYTESKIFDALQELCHLFKSADYSFEKEVRIIRTESRNSENIQYYNKAVGEEPAPPKHFYVRSYKRMLPYLRKIYLGPKVKDPAHWSLHFDYSLRQSARKEETDIKELTEFEKEIKSGSSLNAGESEKYERLKRNYGGVDLATEKIKPNEIEIIPSKCRFI